MEGIIWTKSKISRSRRHEGIFNYKAKVGCIELWCRPSKTCSGRIKDGRFGWTCSLYFEQFSLGETKREVPLEYAQKEGEKLAIKYLLSHGLTIVRALKRTNLLEDVLSEVGVDL